MLADNRAQVISISQRRSMKKEMINFHSYRILERGSKLCLNCIWLVCEDTNKGGDWIVWL